MVLVPAVNIVFNLAILVLGIWICCKKKDKVPLYIGVAFGIFRIFDFSRILQSREFLSVETMVRALGYCLIIFALYKLWKR